MIWLIIGLVVAAFIAGVIIGAAGILLYIGSGMNW